MLPFKALALFDALEVDLCHRLNRRSRHAPTRHVFILASRLGDGLFWYSLMITLAVMQGADGRSAALQMGITALFGVLIYKALKGSLVRERPFMTHGGIYCATAPLDRYSFPSGHTLHAVLFSTLAIAWFPGLALLLLPTVILIALSRVVLGLHYPTDVLVGGLIGWGLASLSLWFYPVARVAAG
ncbi:MAG: phosphatase PAP2 family protein [Aquisalimonadaceae bacterium]